MTALTWISGGSTGTSLITTFPGAVRTALDGQVGQFGVYHRYQSRQMFRPPFRWTGRIRCRSIMEPPVFLDGVPAWYVPMINLHAMYPSDNRNVIVQFGRHSDPQRTGTTAEMRDERPDRPYGVRTGYQRRNLVRLPNNPYSGWHNFIVDVAGPGQYSLTWDGVLVVDVIEKEPPTISPGPVPVGIRLDFADVELAAMQVQEEIEMKPRYARVHKNDTALLIVTDTTARWLASADEVAAAASVCTNTPTTPVILSARDCAAAGLARPAAPLPPGFDRWPHPLPRRHVRAGGLRCPRTTNGGIRIGSAS